MEYIKNYLTASVIGVMVSLHVSSVRGRGFESRSGQAKDYSWYLLFLR
jgi:hypothetical protein